MSLAEHPTPSDACNSRRFLERLLHEFDAAWAEGAGPPALEDFIPASEVHSPGARSRHVEELVKIDLEYRWRSRDVSAAAPWTLAEYATRLQLDGPFPSCELIGEEYWVRQLWGDRPSHAEYLAKYPQHGELLRERLAQLDAQLQEQFGRDGEIQLENRTFAVSGTHPERDDSLGASFHDTPMSVSASDTNPYGGQIGPAPIVPGFEVLDVLDRGGMAVVYTARQVSLNRIVALKVVRGGEHASPKELERFRAEAEAVASLRHPNIVQVFAAGQWNGMPYCAMELVAGGSLARKLNGLPLSADSAARLTAKLARALHAAHEAGIVHRDLKPANVLLEPTHRVEGIDLKTERHSGQRYEPKVADFGLAKRQGDSTCHTATGELLGTPSYMAPEQAVGNHAQIGPHTDVYALGVLLYEMLTGHPPFRATSSLQTLRQVTRDEPVPPGRLQSAVPRDLETICLKCLEKNPHRRYTSAAELGSDLERFLAGKPILARRASPLERTVKWSRRNPAWAVAIAIAALAIIGFVAGTVRHNRRGEAGQRKHGGSQAAKVPGNSQFQQDARNAAGNVNQPVAGSATQRRLESS
jgi:serine/threonine protein kinase